MKKRIICYFLIVAFIIAGIGTAKYMHGNKKTTKTIANTVNTVNTAVNNKVKNNIAVTNKIKEETTTVAEAEKDENLSPEEKAIKIVKNNWGEDDSVYYSYDGIDENGRYIVCVRDKKTTKALYFYYVDLETETFEID